MKRKLYAAYGSNLNLDQMKARCPGAKPVGAGWLEGHRLVFRAGGHGVYLTVEPAPGAAAPVGVWEITPAHEAALDEYEGWPQLYRKAEAEVAFTEFETGLARRDTVLIYIMQAGHPPARPDEGYLRACREGFLSFGLDTALLEQAVEERSRH